MKNYLALCFLLFFTITHSQDFENLYLKANEDYKNMVVNSPYYDKAIKNCPDIKEYPELLLYKGLDLFFLNKPILGIKYLELAKIYTKNIDDSILITNNLALMYTDIGQNEKADSYYKETLKKALKANDTFFINESRFNILLHKYESSEVKPPLTKFWNFYNNLNHKSKESKFEYLNIFFEMYNDKNANEDASKLKNHIYKNFIINSFNNPLKGFFYQNNAILSSKLKKYEEALKYNDSSYIISKQHLGKEELLDGLYTYKEIYEGKNNLEIALKYVDSIKTIDDELRTANIDIGVEIVNENILFNKTKKNVETKINNYKTFIMFICIAIVLILLVYFLKNKKQQEKVKKLNSKLRISKGKYNKSLKENIEFKKTLKELLKAKKFDELSKFHQDNEINDINNETYIKYLASDIELSFLKKLEKHTFTFNDIEKTLLYYRKNNHTNKEIALITNKTLRSIQSLSYRLNKKILAKTNQNLSTFLEKL